MDNNDVQLVGGPCGQHGPYTFYKAFKYAKNGIKRIVALSEFFFVKMWRDSDLLCIGELQLLWIDKNSEQVLASLRLYFLPENTPEGRMDHGEDEVLAISEKVVIRVEDLVTWITTEAEWNWGRLAECASELKDASLDSSPCDSSKSSTSRSRYTLWESTLDFSDVENERKALGVSNENSGNNPNVVILSYPRYCRYRAAMKRLEGAENSSVHFKLLSALGAFYVINPNTRVLFCRDTFDYPELEGHELLCNHLAPKLKGRPRGKRKKRSVSPGSESNESESSITNGYNTRAENRLRCDSNIATRRSTRCHENNENKEFVRKLAAFMKSNHTPIGRIPSLGYKELNLHEFFTKVQKLGGYDSVTTNRLWKSIFEDMNGHQNSTSAATMIRRHYERFLLSYERHIKGEEYKPLPVSERRRLKSKRGSSSISDAESSSGDATPAPSTSRKTSFSGPPTESKENAKTEGKPSSLRSVRVKTERQKEKQPSNEKGGAENNNNNNNESADVGTHIDGAMTANLEQPVVVKMERVSGEKESSTLEMNFLPIQVDYTAESDSVFAKMKAEIIPITSEVKPVLPDVSSTKAEIVPIELARDPALVWEPVAIKSESVTIKSEPVANKSEPVAIKSEPPEKTTDASTPVAIPIAQKTSPDKAVSPVEGKENIPVTNAGCVATNNILDAVEVPYKSKPAETAGTEPEAYKSAFIHEVKRRKLDILKEGGLEVTPVRPPPPSAKDGRPSVIQQVTAAPAQMIISKPNMAEIMPPPQSPRRTHVTAPQPPNFSRMKRPITSFPYVNESTTPPKVVQSKSIYSYSENTIYGNPKDILSPTTVKSAAHAATKFTTGSVHRQNGSDPVDLSVNSQQAVEIMRVPQSISSRSQSPYNRDAVTKNLYKTAASPLMDGRRLGPNLEITLVGPNSSRSATSNSFNFPTPPLPSPVPTQYPQHRRVSSQYYPPPSMPRNDENGHGKYKPLLPKFSGDLSIPKPYGGKQPEPNQQLPHAQAPVKHYQNQNPNRNQNPNPNQNLPSFSPYLAQLYEGNKGAPQYLSVLDPAMYYSAAMQNLFPNAASTSQLNPSLPILPMPSPEQLKFYAELNARLNFPFELLQERNLPPENNNNFKKP